jgi:hypothetical protein
VGELAWVGVRSSNVSAIAFEEMPTPPYRRLYVRFKSGAVYRYDGVPRGLYEGMLAAPSKGEYLYAVIRRKGTDSEFAYERVG